jgi:glycosyltransferase involved in cell wall biosynthesis
MKTGIMVRTIDEKQGIGIYTLNLLDNLFKIDQRNEYVLFFRNSNYLGRYDGHPNVKEELVKLPSKLLWDQLAMSRMIKKHTLDILFNTKFTVPLFARCPTAMVLHGSEWYIFPEHYSYIDIQYVKLMMPRYLKKAKLIISVSECAKNDMVKYAGADPNKFRIIYLAYNKRFRVIKDENYLKEMRNKYELPEKFILFVGRIFPSKNIGNLIKAYSKITKYIPHKLLLVGGVRWKYKKDLNLIQDLGIRNRVILKEWVEPEDLPAFYNLADLFAFPSRYESCPVPPWEAMACGCPVVTARTGGIPEVVGDAAMYVDPSDPDNIAEGMLKVLTNKELREFLIHEGFKQIKKFSWEKCARETLEALESLNSTARS